jgi:uncharacterized integral membrane protein (TIGR00697 family)
MKKLSLEEKTSILFALFVTALIAANLLGTKITTLAGISVSVGIFAYPITFLITDMIEEVHGKEKAQHLIMAGFVSLLALLALVFISVNLPPASRYDFNSEYKLIFTSTMRITIASLTAFIIAQSHDVWAFNVIKQKTHGKFLWLRNNASTMVSQLIDTTLFMFIAFYHMTPKFTAAFVFSLIVPYYFVKLLVAFADTPFVYAGVRWLRTSPTT